MLLFFYVSEIHILLSDSGIKDWEVFFELRIVFKELIQELKHFLEFHKENELIFVRVH